MCEGVMGEQSIRVVWRRCHWRRGRGRWGNGYDVGGDQGVFGITIPMSGMSGIGWRGRMNKEMERCVALIIMSSLYFTFTYYIMVLRGVATCSALAVMQVSCIFPKQTLRSM